jgi:hypothetical protein
MVFITKIHDNRHIINGTVKRISGFVQVRLARGGNPQPQLIYGFDKTAASINSDKWWLALVNEFQDVLLSECCAAHPPQLIIPENFPA